MRAGRRAAGHAAAPEVATSAACAADRSIRAGRFSGRACSCAADRDRGRRSRRLVGKWGRPRLVRGVHCWRTAMGTASPVQMRERRVSVRLMWPFMRIIQASPTPLAMRLLEGRHRFPRSRETGHAPSPPAGHRAARGVGLPYRRRDDWPPRRSQRRAGRLRYVRVRCAELLDPRRGARVRLEAHAPAQRGRGHFGRHLRGQGSLALSGHRRRAAAARGERLRHRFGRQVLLPLRADGAACTRSSLHARRPGGPERVRRVHPVDAEVRDGAQRLRDRSLPARPPDAERERADARSVREVRARALGGRHAQRPKPGARRDRRARSAAARCAWSSWPCRWR